MKKVVTSICMVFIFGGQLVAQNVGIGINTPAAKLHVNGDLLLQNGSAVSKFSRDSLFSENSHNNVPTEKAIKDFIQRGSWAGANLTTPGPNTPAYRSFFAQNPDGANGVAVQGSFVYTISGLASNTLSIFDFSNPDAPTSRGTISTNLDLPTSVFVSGNYAYVTSAQNNKLCIFNISNPDAITARGTIAANMLFPRCVVVQGNYAYVTSDDLQRLSIFDISNPDAILAKGTGGFAMSAPTSVVVKGNYAYVTCGASSELQIYDISNPNSVVAKAWTNFSLSYPRSVDVAGNYAYVVSNDNNRLTVFDISNPNSITYIATTSLGLSNPNCVRVQGNYALVTSQSSAMLSVFDISIPQNMKLIGKSKGTLTKPMSLAVKNNYIFVANLDDVKALCIFDLDVTKTINFTSSGMQLQPQLWASTENNVYRTNGRVGIGLSTPQQALDVNGNIQASGSLLAASVGAGSAALSGNISASSATVSSNLNFANTLGNKIDFYNNGSTQYGIGLQSGLLQLYGDVSAADIAFGYGNSNSFTESMRIKGNGNVGIGNNNPVKPLSFPATLGEKILLYPGGAGEVGIGVYGNELRLHCDNPGSKVSFGTQTNAGVFTELGKFQQNGAYAMSVFGSIWANGVTYASDERFKQNITPITTPLQKLLQLNGVEYDMKKDAFQKNNFASGRQMGLLAQSVEKIVPEAVSENADGYKGVDYAKLVPLLIEAIKELQKEVEVLKSKK